MKKTLNGILGIASAALLAACSGDGIVGTWEVNADQSVTMEKNGTVKPSSKKADQRKKQVEECKKAGFDVGMTLEGSWKKDGDNYEIVTHSLTRHLEEGVIKKCEYQSNKQVGVLEGDELTI